MEVSADTYRFVMIVLGIVAMVAGTGILIFLAGVSDSLRKIVELLKWRVRR